MSIHWFKMYLDLEEAKQKKILENVVCEMPRISPGLISHNVYNNFRPRALTSQCCHILHLNHDCLCQIFQYLDLASQYALLQAHPTFKDIILHYQWYRYYEKSLAFPQHRHMQKWPKKFQINLMEFLLKNFPKISDIPCDIFKSTMQSTKCLKFENVEELKFAKCLDKDCCMDFGSFAIFSELKNLLLQNCKLSWEYCRPLKALQSLCLISSQFLEDHQNQQQLNQIFSSNLISVDFHPVSRPTTTFRLITFCSNLINLSINFHFLNNFGSLDDILRLPALKKFTLYSYGNLYFTPKDQQILRTILSHRCGKPLSCIEIYGIPDKSFFKDPYLKQLPNFKWSLDRVFHYKSDGYIEWQSNLPEIVQEFYEFARSSTNLKILNICQNVLLSRRMHVQRSFEENLHSERRRGGHGQLVIVSESWRKGGAENDRENDTENVKNLNSDAFICFGF